jgi:hypothetical protein
LITRRSRHRPGTRYFSRGIDAQGHVSNFVETEQLVLYDGPSSVDSKDVYGKTELSYVQTRGSIPVYWTQVINLKYTPRLWIGESRKSVKCIMISNLVTSIHLSYSYSWPPPVHISMSKSVSMVPKF